MTLAWCALWPVKCTPPTECNCRPYCTPVSVSAITVFAELLPKMNRLPGHMVVAHIAKCKIDPYGCLAATAEELDIRQTAISLGLPQKTLRLAMLRPQMRRAWSPQLRYCPRCMSRGYHSVIHQFDCVPSCPVHGCRLETRCRSCGSSCDYLIKASVLDAPFLCPNCRRNYGNLPANFVHRVPLSARDRSAIVRTFIG